ncbi:MAG: tetratricopeptide repeat protein [Gammaproteobacteria bacterium]|nr:tetratricopeptide repeat protein [Gammaproteobacteria bacterium]
MIEPLTEHARIRRLQRICCSYKPLEEARKIIEQTPQMPGDERAAVYAALGDAYVASGKDDRAREAYRQALEALDDDIAQRTFSEPVQIATAEDLHPYERASKRVFEVDRDLLGYRRYREMTIEERLGIETQPPQQFFVPLDGNGREFHIKERSSAADNPADKTRKVVGQPFQFILGQAKTDIATVHAG